ncbi:MAG: deoxyguanosinetriphosphate triphosphohydrolase [Gammaproteobacteria bacterium]|nr:deoxyguanosinetriphosphate triphosphohydrolase [Gammaproteobacteria bacterium]MBM4232604.1 deoxyguanosinetriphosphate triphosphohydrolase [Gammaproteobacteria bacterium]
MAAGAAPWAAQDAISRGRRYREPPPQLRGEFQRDRDRIVHSNAFRRLVYKTQVFVNHEGDLYRTRLTHSMEVAQIGRTIAQALGLHETLTEAICLAHDLGHTPFGHAGQDALNECMWDYGGFEHNLQSLRVVDLLEERYADFPGLNLTFETREGILKHCSANNARLLGELGERFLRRQQPGLEAQLANLADAIAYNNHDVDDGLRSGLVEIDALREVVVFGREYAAVLERYPQLTGRRVIHETIRRMINRVVVDVVNTSRAQIAAARVRSIDDVRSQESPLISLSEAAYAEHLELKRFLNANLYRHHRVLGMTDKARKVLRELFAGLMRDIDLLPREHRDAAATAESAAGLAGRARAVADYVAGMTDRYAIGEHRRLFSADDPL